MVLRTAASAALAGALLAADLVLLTAYLNPGVSLRRDAIPLALCLFGPLLLASAAGLLLLAALLTPLGVRAARPPVEGLPWFTTFAVVSTAAATGLYVTNLVGYRHSLPLEFLHALVGAAVGIGASALVLAGVVADAFLFPRRPRAVAAPVVVLAAAAAVVVPLALRPALRPRPRPLALAMDAVQPARRVVLVGVDGLGPAQIEAAVVRGQVPSLARLIRQGAYGPLATLRPTEGPPVWATLCTGRLPRDHGIKSFASYRLRGSDSVYELLPKGIFVGALERLGLVRRAAVTSAARTRPALWNILNAFGVQAGVVRLWGTHPAESVQGFMLSPSFHRLARGRAEVALHPDDLLAEVKARVVAPADVDAGLVARFVEASPGAEADAAWRSDLVDRALAPDLTYRRAGEVLRAAYDPPLFATYVYGLDVVGHSFTRYAAPERFGDVPAAEARRFGRVVDRYAAFTTEWLEELARALRPDEVLLVVSAYGMEPVPVWRRLLGPLAGDSHRSGTHTAAPEGFVLALGNGVRAGALVRGATVLDVAPTVLYLMGLPVGRDMEGRVLTDMLTDDVIRAQPVTFIPSYESLAVTPLGARPLEPPTEDEAP